MKTNLRNYILPWSLVFILACQVQGISTPVPVAPTATLPPTITATIPPTETQTPLPTGTPGPTSTPEPSPQRLTFTAQDGRTLVGYFYPSWMPNAPVVVLMHQFGANQRGWLESGIIPWMQNWRAVDPTNPPYFGTLPEMPREMSFAVFTFDFRGHGESMPPLESGDIHTNSNAFLMDAQAAYAMARSLPGVDPNRVIGIGTSIGADAVVDACAEWCVGAFSVSPGSWLDVDFAQAAQALLDRGRPVRCMYSAGDPPSPDTCLSIEANGTYQYFGYRGVKHGMTFFVPRKMEPDFGTNLLEFLQAALQ